MLKRRWYEFINSDSGEKIKNTIISATFLYFVFFMFLCGVGGILKIIGFDFFTTYFFYITTLPYAILGVLLAFCGVIASTIIIVISLWNLPRKIIELFLNKRKLKAAMSCLVGILTTISVFLGVVKIFSMFNLMIFNNNHNSLTSGFTLFLLSIIIGTRFGFFLYEDVKNDEKNEGGKSSFLGWCVGIFSVTLALAIWENH